ncbi:MAG: hypothetical protein V7K89_21355 [Nostoc sp.]
MRFATTHPTGLWRSHSLGNKLGDRIKPSNPLLTIWVLCQNPFNQQ